MPSSVSRLQCLFTSSDAVSAVNIWSAKTIFGAFDPTYANADFQGTINFALHSSAVNFWSGTTIFPDASSISGNHFTGNGLLEFQHVVNFGANNIFDNTNIDFASGGEFAVPASTTINVPVTVNVGTFTVIGPGKLTLPSLTLWGSSPTLKGTNGGIVSVAWLLALSTNAALNPPNFDTVTVWVTSYFNCTNHHTSDGTVDFTDSSLTTTASAKAYVQCQFSASSSSTLAFGGQTWVNPVVSPVTTTFSSFDLKFLGGMTDFVWGAVSFPGSTTCTNATLTGPSPITLADGVTFGSGCVVKSPSMIFNGVNFNLEGGATIQVWFDMETGTITVGGQGIASVWNATIGAGTTLQGLVGSNAVLQFGALNLNGATLDSAIVNVATWLLARGTITLTGSKFTILKTATATIGDGVATVHFASTSADTDSLFDNEGSVSFTTDTTIDAKCVNNGKFHIPTVVFNTYNFDGLCLGLSGASVVARPALVLIAALALAAGLFSRN